MAISLVFWTKIWHSFWLPLANECWWLTMKGKTDPELRICQDAGENRWRNNVDEICQGSVRLVVPIRQEWRVLRLQTKIQGLKALIPALAVPAVFNLLHLWKFVTTALALVGEEGAKHKWGMESSRLLEEEGLVDIDIKVGTQTEATISIHFGEKTLKGVWGWCW